MDHRPAPSADGCEGVEFKVNHLIADAPLGAGNGSATRIEPGALLAGFDAIVLSGGAEAPRDLPIAGRDLKGSNSRWISCRCRIGALPVIPA
jgi:NADPH-dependent glutamate synthase beta subunit-like oxidoreductase